LLVFKSVLVTSSLLIFTTSGDGTKREEFSPLDKVLSDVVLTTVISDDDTADLVVIVVVPFLTIGVSVQQETAGEEYRVGNVVEFGSDANVVATLNTFAERFILDPVELLLLIFITI